MTTMRCETQKKRIDNLNMAYNSVKKFGQKMRITDYMPGQITYRLGDYPKPFKIEPTEYDENLIKSLKERGFEMIQVHSDWHDWCRLYGGDDYTSHDEEGMKNFVHRDIFKRGNKHGTVTFFRLNKENINKLNVKGIVS